MKKQIFKMKILRNSLIFCLMLFFSHVSIASSQVVKVSVNLNNVTINEIIDHVSQKINYRFLYQVEQVQQYGKRNICLQNADLNLLMKTLLKNTHLSYTIQNDVIIITPEQQKEVTKVLLQGKVTDDRNDPLPGVTIRIKNTYWGVSSDIKGQFRLEVPATDSVILIFTFVGKKTKEITIHKVNFQKPVNIIMDDDIKQMEEAVVTGITSNLSKQSFTGSAVTVTQEQLLKVSKTNVLKALEIFDPSFRIQKNNVWGSDPNSIPEITIRGQSGIGVRELDKETLAEQSFDKKDLTRSALENNPNLPTFIMDGFEVSIQKVYDTDPNRIESVSILKDAAATAMYGSRAANGVVVITTVAPKPGRLMVSYSMAGNLTFPDLSDYNLANAEEKLEIERLSGLYEPERYAGSLHNAMRNYNERLQLIREGVNTDWLAIPLRNTFEHQHSLFIEGGNRDLRYGLSGTFHKQPGVMKGSSRDRTEAGFYIDYRLKSLQMTNNITYSFIKGTDSPYGDFGDYSKLMPYDRPYDKEGNLEKRLKYSNIYGSAELSNPLYEAMLSNFTTDKQDEFIDNFRINWYITSTLFIKGQFSITKRFENKEHFIDPFSAQVSVKGGNKEDAHLLGDLYLTKGEYTKWDGSIYLNYQQTIGKHSINFTAGMDALSSKIARYMTHYRGFPSGELHSPNYAADIYKTQKSQNQTRLLSGLASINYTLDNIYLLDAAARFDGSSEFGLNQKWAPFWSMGLGINIHNYAFLKDNPILSRLKLKASYGQTGKVNFAPYCATTIYESQFEDKTWYATGYGVTLKYLGNKNLTWETTNKFNTGAEIEFARGLFFLEGNYYHHKTIDLITDITLPSSSGFKVYKDNMGEVLNQGFELNLKLNPIRSKNWNLMIYANLAHNKNKILKISDSQKAYNEKVNEYYKEAEYLSSINREINDPKYSRVIPKYEEGGSLTSIFAMKSLGIDPTTGKELLLRRDGSVTTTWEASQMSIVGNTEPKAQGAFGFNLTWKNISLFTSFQYEWGAQSYNYTLVNDVENADIEFKNVDKRVLTQRWQKPGDITPLKDIRDRNSTTMASSRFVQNNNILTLSAMTLSYDLEQKWTNKLGLSLVRFELSTNDIVRFSSIRQERGTSYPFARIFNFSFKASF